MATYKITRTNGAEILTGIHSCEDDDAARQLAIQLAREWMGLHAAEMDWSSWYVAVLDGADEVIARYQFPSDRRQSLAAASA